MTQKSLSAKDIQTSTSFLNQLIDVVAQDVSSSASSSTRRKYQVFVTGGVGPGVTSSLFQTVYDQDFSLQTSNPMFDMTIGIFSGSSTVSSVSTGQDANGKLLFPSTSIMMREKINIYRQYAQLVLGDADSSFSSPFGSSTAADRIDNALFLHYKRLFFRDGIRRETYAMKFFQTGVMSNAEDGTAPDRPTINVTSTSGSVIFTDVGSSTALQRSQGGGDVGDIVDSSNTNRKVGNIFYQQGLVVLDMSKIISGTQHVSGVIGGMRSGTYKDAASGQIIIGDSGEGNPNATYIPDFITSASIDDIIDHIASTRFGDSSTVSITFQNQTLINSTLYYCNAAPDEFNFSSNPTYTDSEGRVRVIDANATQTDKPFSFITTIGLYDAGDELLAVAKLSRPVEKNEEKNLTFRVRLDY